MQGVLVGGEEKEIAGTIENPAAREGKVVSANRERRMQVVGEWTAEADNDKSLEQGSRRLATW
jgi:hypothetical protein